MSSPIERFLLFVHTFSSNSKSFTKTTLCMGSQTVVKNINFREISDSSYISEYFIEFKILNSEKENKFVTFIRLDKYFQNILLILLHTP